MKTTIHAVGPKSPKSRTIMGTAALMGVLMLAGCTANTSNSADPSNQKDNDYISVEAYSGGTLVGRWTVEDTQRSYGSLRRGSKSEAYFTDVEGTNIWVNGDFIVTGLSAKSVAEAVEKTRRLSEERQQLSSPKTQQL